MRAILQDVRFAIRVFSRRRALTAVAVLSLAIATGPNAALFGLIHGLFFRHLPVGQADQLVGLRAMKTGRGEAFTYPDWLDIRQRTTTLEGVAAWERAALPLSLESRTELLTANYVSSDYFTTLGVTPAIGRLFSADQDERPRADLPLVISHSYWLRRFGGDPAAIGAMPQVLGRTFVIVGVAPRGFRGLDVQFPVDGWLPFSVAEAVGRIGAKTMADREHGQFENLLGRLKPGATVERANVDVDRIGRDLAAAYPATNQGRVFGAFSYLGDRTAKGLTAGGIALGLVGLVLLVACANVAGLLLSLADVRRREVAVRLALGASRWRIVRQLMTEGVLLWLAGALVGLLFAAWLMRIPIAPPLGTVALDFDIRFDTAVFLYTIGLALFTSVLFGLAPALQATRKDIVSGVKAARTQWVARRSWTRGALVAGQIAVSQFLLAAAVIGVRSYVNVLEFRPGFDSQRNILTISLAPRAAGQPVTPARRAEFFDRLRAIPGVVEVSAAGSIPLSGSGGGLRQAALWPGAAEPVQVRANSVKAKYFDVMGIRLVGGRDFDARDEAAANTVIVNQALARRIAPTGSAVDRWISVEGTPRQIVGVAEDGRYVTLRDDPEPYLYLPAAAPGLILIETAAGAAGVPEAVHRAVAEVVPQLYVADLSTLGDIMRFARYPDVMAAWLVGGLGLLAVFLTAVGVYGTVAHSVASRTHEFGVRMALGADRGRVLGMVLGQGLRLAAVGAPIGLVAAVIGGMTASKVLFGVSPADPSSYLAGAVAVAAVVAIACFGPARRASGVEPAAALRHE